MTRERWTPALAALATLLAMWSLAPVVEGNQWQGGCLLVVLVVLASGMLLRLAHLPATLVGLGQLAAGIVALTAYFAGSEAVLGLIPGPDALASLQVTVADGLDTVNRYAAPVPATRGLSLLLAGGVLLVALLVDVLAVGRRSPAAAGLPLLALYCVPAAVVPEGLSWPYFIVGATGWLLLVAHDAGSTVLRWGRLLPRWGSGGTASRESVIEDTSALAATGRRLGVAAIAVAVALPALAPGLSEGLLTRGGSGGSASARLTVINPVLTLRDSLTPRQNVEVLRLRTDQADVAPLRIVTADKFDGKTWSPSVTEVSRAQRADRGLPTPPGLGAGVSAQTYRMQVKVGDTLDQDFLPLPYPTRRVDIDGRWLYDASSLNVIGDGETVRGEDYTATYLAVRPTVEQLRDAGQPPLEISSTYTRLPRSLPASVRAMAHAVTEGATTEYDQAMALQQWFRQDGKFTYSTDAPADSGGDAVAEFLVARKGFCIQFSSAMAVMARALGIPARIGVGFLPGRPGPDQWRSVLLTDAHAWPELYFEGVGWVRFEPTPASRSGAAPSWAQPATSSTSGDGSGAASGTAGSANAAEQGASDAKTRQLEREEAQPPRSADGAAPLEQSAGATGAGTVAVPRRVVAVGAAVVAVLLLLLLVPVTAAVSRRLRRRRARDRRALVDAAWDELAERVGDLGVTVPVGATPRQLAAQLAGHLPASRPSPPTGLGSVGHVGGVADGVGIQDEAHRSLRRARQTVERSRYSRAGADPSAAGVDASSMLDDVRTVVRSIAAGRSRRDRLTARLLPASGRRLLRGWVERQGRQVARVDLGAARGVRLLVPRRGRA
jgi:transglutaminase-like putative cysteine protease